MKLSVHNYTFPDEVSTFERDQITDTNYQLYLDLSIENPPSQKILLIDTGSNLIWVQCDDCNGYKSGTKFYTSKSSTYKRLLCRDSRCPIRRCGIDVNCSFSQGYSKGQYVNGFLRVDDFEFEAKIGKPYVVNELLFGCSNGTIKRYGLDKESGGVLGLDGRSKLLELFGLKFSICIGSFIFSEYSRHYIILEDDTMLYGPSLPLLESFSRHYFASLKSMSIGYNDYEHKLFDQYVDVPTIFDTRAKVLRLPQKIYNSFITIVENFLQEGFVRVLTKFGICYEGVLNKDLPRRFPKLVFRFENEVNILAQSTSSFRQQRVGGDHLVCLNVSPWDGHEIIIGLATMQNYNIEFDILNEKLHFLPFTYATIVEKMFVKY